MNFDDKFFQSKKDPITKQAEGLVSSAEIFAISLFTPTLGRFPILATVDVKNWDFIISISGIFIALTQLNNFDLPEDQKSALINIVEKKLSEWNPDGIRAFEDCKSFFESQYDQSEKSSEYKKDRRFLASDALGIWVVWNILNRQPQNDEEISLVRVIGSSVVHAFFDWWQANKV